MFDGIVWFLINCWWCRPNHFTAFILFVVVSYTLPTDDTDYNDDDNHNDGYCDLWISQCSLSRSNNVASYGKYRPIRQWANATVPLPSRLIGFDILNHVSRVWIMSSMPTHIHIYYTYTSTDIHASYTRLDSNRQPRKGNKKQTQKKKKKELKQSITP